MKSDTSIIFLILLQGFPSSLGLQILWPCDEMISQFLLPFLFLQLATKRLTRGLSAVNTKLVSYGRQRVIDDEESHNYQLVETPRFTFTLPDLLAFPPDFRAFVEKDLIDSCTMVNLENSGILIFWNPLELLLFSSVHSTFPIFTKHDELQKEKYQV